MKVIIYGESQESQELIQKVDAALEDLGLKDFIEVSTSSDEELKTTLNIQKSPALIVEEESIDFRDTIFEGIVPADDEIKSMFISIIGGGDSGSSCGSGGCG